MAAARRDEAKVRCERAARRAVKAIRWLRRRMLAVATCAIMIMRRGKSAARRLQDSGTIGSFDQRRAGQRSSSRAPTQPFEIESVQLQW
tara:strand:- start:409 stop:675 length:267 start_codon:yes stop_codon:yes gene_type:complete